MNFIKETWNRQFRNVHLFLAALAIGALFLDAWQYTLIMVVLVVIIWVIAWFKRNAE